MSRFWMFFLFANHAVAQQDVASHADALAPDDECSGQETCALSALQKAGFATPRGDVMQISEVKTNNPEQNETDTPLRGNVTSWKTSVLNVASGHDCDWSGKHDFCKGWEVCTCSRSKSAAELACDVFPPLWQACGSIVKDLKDLCGQVGVSISLNLAKDMLSGKAGLPDGRGAKAAVITGTKCRAKPLGFPVKMLNRFRACLAYNKKSTQGPPAPPKPATPPKPSDSAKYFLPKFAREVSPWNGCVAGGFAWATNSGSQLAMEKQGTLAFYPGKGNGYLLQLTPTWDVVTGKEDTCVSFDSRGVALRRHRKPDEQGEPPAAWVSKNYGKEKAEKIVIFDKHWSIFVRRDVYWLKSSQNYPADAPSATEILPWNGCALGMTWSTPGGARLSMERSGTFAFYPGKGDGHLLQLTPTWDVVTGKAGVGACFDSDGNVVLRQGNQKLWQSDTFAGGVAPKKAVKIFLFDHGWALFDEEGKAIRTYPWDYHEPY